MTAKTQILQQCLDQQLQIRELKKELEQARKMLSDALAMMRELLQQTEEK